MPGPDFSGSSIIVEPAQPFEGDLVTLNAIVRNSGERAPNTEVELQLPPGALFVDVSGLDDAAVNLETRTIAWQGAVDAGSMRAMTVLMIVPRDAGGEALRPTLHVRQLYTATEAWVHGEGEIQTRVGDDGVELFGTRVTPAGLVVIGLIAFALIGRVLLRTLVQRVSRQGRRTGGPTAGIWAITLAVGFWVLFATMAWRDWRSMSAFVETPCTILDSRLRFSTTTSTGGPVGRRTTTTAEPLLALRYIVNGRPMVSTGFDTGSRLQIGKGGREAESFERWRVGTDVPCWYDPDDPQDVVVIRGFGGAYLFALFPLPVFLLGLWLLRRRT